MSELRNARWLVFAALALACRSESRDTPPAPGSAKPTTQVARPLRVFVESGKAEPSPLVVALHGYGGDAQDALSFFALGPLARSAGFHVLAPDGTLDGQGRRFWNAVDACCDFEHRGVDDVKYLLDLVDAYAATHAVDRSRVYAVGLSNGGAMALRLACDAADRFAAVVSVAAPFHDDASRCKPKQAVAVRHLHGTADRVVPFEGGTIVSGIHPAVNGTPRKMPGAKTIVATWASLDGCGAEEQGEPLDVDRTVPGAETTVSRFRGCRDGAVVELFTMNGAQHVPRVDAAFASSTWSFLSAHHR